jgi:hypothetical protein
VGYDARLKSPLGSSELMTNQEIADVFKRLADLMELR